MTDNFSQITEASCLPEPKSGLNLLDLPQEVLLHILSFMSYHNVSEIRRVWRFLVVPDIFPLKNKMGYLPFHDAEQRQRLSAYVYLILFFF